MSCTECWMVHGRHQPHCIFSENRMTTPTQPSTKANGGSETPKRYSANFGMGMDEKGDFVSYEDYAALEARLAEAIASIQMRADHVIRLVARSKSAEYECESLRTQLEEAQARNKELEEKLNAKPAESEELRELHIAAERHYPQFLPIGSATPAAVAVPEGHARFEATLIFDNETRKVSGLMQIAAAPQAQPESTTAEQGKEDELGICVVCNHGNRINGRIVHASWCSAGYMTEQGKEPNRSE